MITYLYRALNLNCTIIFWPLIHSGSRFLAPMRFIHNTNNIIFIIINFYRRVFSEYTEAVTTSLIPIDAILPEIFTFIVGFSCTA